MQYRKIFLYEITSFYVISAKGKGKKQELIANMSPNLALAIIRSALAAPSALAACTQNSTLGRPK